MLVILASGGGQDQGFELILGYTAGLKPAWATWDWSQIKINIKIRRKVLSNIW